MIFNKIKIAVTSILENQITLMPPEFSNLKRMYYKKKGIRVEGKVTFATNVKLKGNVQIKSGSSIAQNCILSGENVGIFIGSNVMIAPGCVIVAFDHGFARMDIPMSQQDFIEAPVYIEDDVWISANCTITKGVRIGTGSIIAANSAVTKDIPPYSIAGGVPARVIKSRISNLIVTE
jgi:acetyltransferase-like isoleucine patch superfamily enzyme